MSENRAEQFEVKVTTENLIEITQDRTDGSGNEDIVVIHPAQLDLLVAWLREAAKEAATDS